jgi:hypothetical protein
VQLAAHGRAQDDAGAFGVERPVGVAVVGQRVGGDGDGPLLPSSIAAATLGGMRNFFQSN